MSDDAQRDLRNLLVFALVDGKMSPEEMAFLDTVREKLGLDSDQMGTLCQEVMDGRKSVSMPRDPAAARRSLELMAELARVDGRVAGRERRAIETLAAHVGLSKADVAAVLGETAAADDAPSDEPAPVVKTPPPPPNDESAAVSDAFSGEVDAMCEEIYTDFAQWDAPTREAKLPALADMTETAVVPLLRILESYRTPSGMADNLVLKQLVARQLGQIGDTRSLYYLAQQVSLGDVEDEVTSFDLRVAASQAIGEIVGETFPPDQDGIEAARAWWLDVGTQMHNQLAF